MELLYLKNKQIDMIKWDRCINNAYNGNIYAFSWYLNVVCHSWDAIVYDNYRAVFPLPVKKNMGISQLYHPILAGQLGIFSIDKLDGRLIQLFLERIPHKFKKINIKLNKYINLEKSDFSIKKQPTYVIDLIRNTSSIYSEYDKDLRAAVDKALLKNLGVINALRPQEVVNFIVDDDTDINRPLKPENLNQLKKIMSSMVSNHLGTVYGVYSDVNNLCAMGFFLFSHNKISVPILAVNQEGRDNNAIELLIHTVIYNNVEKHVTLAYEDTQHKYFTNIIASFGAEKKNYKELLKIRLIWPLNKLLS